MTETICICGLGKVGKPILDTLRWKGFDCIGYDIDAKLTEATLAYAVQETTAAIESLRCDLSADRGRSNQAHATARS